MISICGMNKLRCQSITIFNRWGTALSQDQTLIWVLRRELKGWFTAEYFWRATRCLILWFNTVSSVWYYFFIKMKKQRKQALIWRLFPLYFLYKSLTTLRSNHLQFPRELTVASFPIPEPNGSSSQSQHYHTSFCKNTKNVIHHLMWAFLKTQPLKQQYIKGKPHQQGSCIHF